MNKKNPVIFIIILSLVCFSCSIDYGNSKKIDKEAPEFVFSNVKFIRVEDGSKNTIMQAGTLEQYSDENVMYGENLNFSVLNKENEVSVTGSCGLFSANSDTEEYIFFDNVNIISYEQDLMITAENLKWNNKNEQLVSAGKKPVTISKGGFKKDSGETRAEISGLGFSASGHDFSYSFDEEVSGTISTKEESDDTEDDDSADDYDGEEDD